MDSRQQEQVTIPEELRRLSALHRLRRCPKDGGRVREPSGAQSAFVCAQNIGQNLALGGVGQSGILQPSRPDARETQRDDCVGDRPPKPDPAGQLRELALRTGEQHLIDGIVDRRFLVEVIDQSETLRCELSARNLDGEGPKRGDLEADPGAVDERELAEELTALTSGPADDDFAG